MRVRIERQLIPIGAKKIIVLQKGKMFFIFDSSINLNLQEIQWL